MGARGSHNLGHWPPPAISLAPKGNIEWLPNLQILKQLMQVLISAVSTAVPAALTEVITLGRTLKRRAEDVLAYFDRARYQ